jgi:hypothetical protein
MVLRRGFRLAFRTLQMTFVALGHTGGSSGASRADAVMGPGTTAANPTAGCEPMGEACWLTYAVAATARTSLQAVGIPAARKTSRDTSSPRRAEASRVRPRERPGGRDSGPHQVPRRRRRHGARFRIMLSRRDLQPAVLRDCTPTVSERDLGDPAGAASKGSSRPEHLAANRRR